MERRLIGHRVRFWYFTEWGERWWYVNGQRHCEDGYPAYEKTKIGYHAWWYHGEFVRNNL